MKKIIAVFFLSIFLIAGVLFAVSRITGKTPYAIKTGKTTVIKQIRSLNRWETASFTVEKVIDAGTAGNTFKELLFGDRLLLIAHGEVIAGFDLSRLEENAVSITGTSITIDLPSAEIFFATLNNEQTRVYDRQQGLLSKGDKDLESSARVAAENSIRQAACDGDILKVADENGRKQLSALLMGLGFEDVTITSPTASC